MSNKILLNDGKKLKLWGKSILIIDWGNIYKTYCEQIGITNFKESYNFLISLLEKITNNFSSTKILKENIFVFVGIDENIHGSIIFVEKIKQFLGDNNIFSKKVKIFNDQKGKIKRKADFDAEIGCFICENINNFKTFIILSSDGDFAKIYEKILLKGKQIFVFHGITKEKVGGKIKEKNNLGKEIWDLFRKYKPKIIAKNIKELK